MLSTPRKLFCFKKEPKTPLGFCDGPSRATGYLSCFHCGTEDRYCQPYDPENEFHEAVCMGKLKVVVHLLRKKQFHVNDEDEGKRTALHFACFYGHIDLVCFLIFKDCEINALDNQMSTPLMKAVQSWEMEIVSVLLDHGADPNIKDCNGEAAIHHAVYVDRPDIASSLLEFGGNIEDTTKDGLTPLLLALRERKPRMAAYLITHGANLHASDQYLRTTLMYAVRWDCENMVEILLKKGVDHQLKDTFGWSALYYAIMGKRKTKMVIIQHELLLWKQQNTFTRNQPEDVFSSGHHFESESLISVCTGMEDTANLKTQQDIPENSLKSGADDLPIASKQYENVEEQEEELELETIPDLELENANVCHKNEDYQKLKAAQSSNVGNGPEENEIIQVWAEKCPHPELRDFCHLVSRSKPETQQSQTVWAEKCPHPEQRDYSHRISKPKSETQRSQSVWAEKCPHPEQRDYSHRISKPKSETQQSQAVWAEKCPHPELRDYSHPISKPESLPHQSQPDIIFSEELEEEITEFKVENERSFDKSAENQEFSVSDPNGPQKSSTKAPDSSNMDNDAEKNVIMHQERTSVMEDQEHASEEQRQHSARKTKRPFHLSWKTKNMPQKSRGSTVQEKLSGHFICHGRPRTCLRRAEAAQCKKN
ncbi:putative POTE ankyrin domain family member M isoform X7 [Peromyscus eremicus]|uniref:putative POTE ankyrin domain family member M isoform X7 n=1 Tax=Peromyscus eremicus TaxID=42410 RepID=UPI0027DDABBB|nr:putative POTE ankyrin domain family member M isoform X7 [Peromyscus eremicus]XP_059121174.1 putative POTE ankyrin domain family member M isoform X7 [Peromyscus eremicus]XP_059121175.1 putative POTE ankyrin domain family member M isoform X7 [Peromyscus eremicus]